MFCLAMMAMMAIMQDERKSVLSVMMRLSICVNHLRYGNCYFSRSSKLGRVIYVGYVTYAKSWVQTGSGKSGAASPCFLHILGI